MEGEGSKMSAARRLAQKTQTIENHLRDKKCHVKLPHQDNHQETLRRLQRCAGGLELDWPASVEERPLGRALVLDPAPPIPCLAAHCLPYGFSRSSPGRRPTTRLASLALAHLARVYRAVLSAPHSCRCARFCPQVTSVTMRVLVTNTSCVALQFS